MPCSSHSLRTCHCKSPSAEPKTMSKQAPISSGNLHLAQQPVIMRHQALPLARPFERHCPRQLSRPEQFLRIVLL